MKNTILNTTVNNFCKKEKRGSTDFVQPQRFQWTYTQHSKKSIKNEYKKEDLAPGKIVEESKSPVGAHFWGKKKTTKTEEIGVGLKEEK